MRYVIGVELGGTKLQAALGDETGALKFLKTGAVTASEGRAGIQKWLAQTLPGLIEEAKAAGCCPECICVGFGGPVDTASGSVVCSNQISGWDGYPLGPWIQELTNIPTLIMNDSNMACLGEYACGIGNGADRFCYMNIGSGIGGGMVLKGKLCLDMGMEIGHTYVPSWVGGTSEQLELLCSGWSIEKRLRTPGYVPESSSLAKLAPEMRSCRTLGSAAAEGDAFALSELDRVADAVGIAVTNVITLTDAQVFAIGGGVSNLGEPLLERIREAVARYKSSSVTANCRIEKCQLSDLIVVVGAVIYGIQAITE